MRFHACLIALSAILATPLAAFAADRALVIGNNNYQEVRPNLRGSIPDAEHVGKLLVDALGYQAENVEVIKDGTRAQILGEFQHWLIDGTNPGDRVLFYYSGHGANIKVPDGNGGTRLTSALVPVDTHDDKDLIIGPEIGALLNKIRDRDVTIIADSCESGSISRDPAASQRQPPEGIRTITPFAPFELRPEDLTDEEIVANKTTVKLIDTESRDPDRARKGLAVWTAAGLTQYSWDTVSGGVFTSAFIAGLNGMKADSTGSGKVTASQLLAWVRKASDDFCATNPECQKVGLTPDLEAPDDYRAAALVPYRPADNGTPPSQTPPELTTGPELVDLATGVLTHTNDFDLKAEILPGQHVRLGQTAQFRITSGEAGKLVVFDSGPDGKFTRLFPNEYSAASHHDGAVNANAPLTIPDESYPFQFTATDAGPGTLIVLVAEKGADLTPLLQGPAFEDSTGAGKALVAVATNLQAPVLNPDPNVPNRARRWAFVTVPYVVQ